MFADVKKNFCGSKYLASLENTGLVQGLHLVFAALKHVQVDVNQQGKSVVVLHRNKYM